MVIQCSGNTESASLFKVLFEDALAKHLVSPNQLTHADRGPPP